MPEPVPMAVLAGLPDGPEAERIFLGVDDHGPVFAASVGRPQRPQKRVVRAQCSSAEA